MGVLKGNGCTLLPQYKSLCCRSTCMLLILRNDIGRHPSLNDFQKAICEANIKHISEAVRNKILFTEYSFSRFPWLGKSLGRIGGIRRRHKRSGRNTPAAVYTRQKLYQPATRDPHRAYMIASCFFILFLSLKNENHTRQKLYQPVTRDPHRAYMIACLLYTSRCV